MNRFIESLADPHLIPGYAAIMLLVLLFAVYRKFSWYLGRFFLHRPVQATTLVLFSLLITGQIGQGLGLPLLFWGEEPSARFFVAFCSTLLLASIGVNGYYLLPEENRGQAMRAVFHFLGEPYLEVAPHGRENRLVRVLRSIPRIVFLDFRSFDPKEETPPSNAYELSRFLRLVRVPFLSLLAMPALFPTVFVNVPRFAPIVKNIQKREFYENTADMIITDVGQYGSAYWLALSIWLTGIWSAVMLIKLTVKLSPIVGDWIRPLVKPIDSVWQFLARGSYALRDLVSGYPAEPEAVDPLAGQRQERKIWAAAYLSFAALVFVVMGSFPVFAGFSELEEYYPSFLLSVLRPIYPYQGIAPAVAILAALSMPALLCAFICIYFPRWGRVLACILLLAWVSWNNRLQDSFRFEKLNYSSVEQDDPFSSKTTFQYNPLASDSVDSPASKAQLIPNKTALEAWKAQCVGETRPKMVLVCTSGGATRSAYWTATVLERIGQEIEKAARPEKPNDPKFDFHRHVRIITGASGGMVGASYYVNWLKKQVEARKEGDGTAKPISKSKLVDTVPIYSLMKVARFLALRESVLAISRRLVRQFGAFPDRGRALEQDWVDIRYPFSSLKPLEEKGEIPSLIFSPMTVEDGRRLLISNLDLSIPSALQETSEAKEEAESRRLPLSFTRGSVLTPGKQADQVSPMSMTGIEYYKVFPVTKIPGANESTIDNELMLSTAARMSATFPYVSPAVNLPTVPPLRVVDAGYYDNYGVDIAAAWVFANREWLLANTSGVLILQIRDALSRKDRFDYNPEPDGIYERLFRGVQFFGSPIDAVARARYSSSSFRNDALIGALGSYFTERAREQNIKSGPDKPSLLERDFLTTVTFELASRTILPIRQPIWDWPGDALEKKIEFADESQSTEVAMSWYLTVAERQAIDMAIPFPLGAKPENFKDDSIWGSGTLAVELARVLRVPSQTLSDPDEASGKFLITRLDDDKPDYELRARQIGVLRERIKNLRKNYPQFHPYGSDQAIEVLDKERARAENYERCVKLVQWWLQ